MPRHRGMVAPINSEKHYVQHPSFSVSASSATALQVVDAVQIQAKDASFEVDQGSVVKAIWFELWISTNAAVDGEFATVVIVKLPSDVASPTFTEMNNLGTYTNKKNILWTFEGLTPANSQNPVPIIRNWVRIPKGKQRMGLGDRIVMVISSAANGIRACGFNTYKEYK